MISNLKLSSLMYLLGALGLIVIYAFALINLHHSCLKAVKSSCRVWSTMRMPTELLRRASQVWDQA